tara:strand:- start:18906 stop:19871 length:966 start_codon:yes stop_codon:yes gene_type:complete
MIKALLYHPDTNQIEQGDEKLIDRWRTDSSAILWVDLENVQLEQEQALLEGFELHPLAIQDAVRSRHPPKIEVFSDHLFVLLRGLDADYSGIEFGVIQLALFAGERFFITRHTRRSTSTNWLISQVLIDPSMFKEGPKSLVVHLANRLVRRYVEILLAFEPRLDEIEQEIFDRPEDSLLFELTRHKGRLREIRRIASYHLSISSELVSDPSIVGAELSHEVIDVLEQVERTVSLAELYYETAKDLTDGYIALSTHRLNRVMQILTVITVIFVPLTFIAGIYGMNFENMPELRTSTGYFFVLGFMTTVGIVLLALFRRKGWV